MSFPVAPRGAPRIGAFFDMDKTLIAENSGSLYMKYRYARGEISGVDLLRGLGAYIQYKLGVLDIRNWTKNMMVQFRGLQEAELEKEALQWFDEMVAATIYPEAARKHDAVLVPFVLEGVAGIQRLNQADGVHPTTEGQKVIADTVWRTLEPLLGSR